MAPRALSVAEKKARKRERDQQRHLQAIANNQAQYVQQSGQDQAVRIISINNGIHIS